MQSFSDIVLILAMIHEDTKLSFRYFLNFIPKMLFGCISKMRPERMKDMHIS